jgi:hypothetical protein
MLSPETLRSIAQNDYMIDGGLLDCADAWEAERAFANEDGTSMNRQLVVANGRIAALEAEVAELRGRLAHMLAWAGQSQTALTSRQVADAVMGMCQDALTLPPAEDDPPPKATGDWLAYPGKEE